METRDRRASGPCIQRTGRPGANGSSIGRAIPARREGVVIANTEIGCCRFWRRPWKGDRKFPLAVRPDNLCFQPERRPVIHNGRCGEWWSSVFPYRIPEVKETVLAWACAGAMCASEQFLFIANRHSGRCQHSGYQDAESDRVAAVGAEPASSR